MKIKMSNRVITSVLISASLFIQCPGLQEINPPTCPQSNDLETTLQETRDIILSEYLEGYKIFQNVSQTATSSVLEIRNKTYRAIEEIRKTHLGQFDKLKVLGKGAAVDEKACLKFFQFHEKDVTSALDECFSEKIERFRSALQDYHLSYNEDLLSVLYKIDSDSMSCTSSKCLSGVVSTLEELRITLPGSTKSRLSKNERELIEYLKDVETCGDKIFALREAVKAGEADGFQICVDNSDDDDDDDGDDDDDDYDDDDDENDDEEDGDDEYDDY